MKFRMGGEEMNNGEENEESGITTRTRIFVGGLGESVTEDDVRKTFSSLGLVEEVDIVRTKGRSFAYMNFYPNSDHTLSKLFSTYNGCIWKGGRLRLERAKEHYVERLRREWSEDAQLAATAMLGNDMVVDKKTVPSEKSKKSQKMERNSMHIFFPKARKMKSLPLSGTGKHKYSFQRTEASVLPSHFCDCEEHCGPSHLPTGKSLYDLEQKTGGMNVEELDMMNSIMNKLLCKEKCSKAASPIKMEWPVEVKGSGNLFEDSQSDENKSSHSMEDNLVMNFVAGGVSDMMGSLSPKQEAFSTNQVPRHFKGQTDNGEKIGNPEEGSGRKIAHSMKKKKKEMESLPMETQERVQPQKPSWRELVVSSEATQSSLSQMLGGIGAPIDGQLAWSGGLDSEIPSRQKDKIEIKSASGGLLWEQKSPWMQLVGDLDSSSFSIAGILKTSGSEKAESGGEKAESAGDGGGRSVTTDLSKEEECATMDDDKGAFGVEVEGHGGAAVVAKGSPVDGGMAEGQFFMRNDGSMKEWKRVKAALSGSLKRKGRCEA